MKNKKIIRKFTVLLAALVIMCGFSVTAYAGGGDESDDTPTPVTEETPAPETEPEETTGGYEPQPLTPDGNMSLVDDITGEASGDKQFITVVTKSGNYFYIIIDRAEDGENTVHFLNQVDEADLTALMEDGQTEAPVCSCTDKCVAGSVNTAYEKRLLTYPRTDSKYITSDMEGSTKELITGLCAALPFMQGVKLQADLARICDNSKVTDHHAILPTAEFVKTGFSSLAESEKKLMTLVCAKLLCAVAAPYEYEAVTAVFTCGGYTFTAKGRTTLCEGWREIERLSRAASGEQDEDAEPEAVLPPLAEGQTFDNPAAEISERYTQPPKAFTEDTLLSAMESAGKEDTPEDAERKGLGTTATRAGIIEKLISAGFAERKGKKLIPTKDGYNLVAILPDSLTSPQLTAEWETRLTGIAKGSDSPADFMRGIEEMTAGLVKTYSAISEDKAKLFTPQREAIGTCPRCGAAVYEGKKNFYCSDRACSFVMWKNDRFFEQRKKAFTKAIAAALLKDGKVKIKGMYSTKTGKTFDGVVLLADTGGKYVNFRVEQNRK